MAKKPTKSDETAAKTAEQSVEKKKVAVKDATATQTSKATSAATSTPKKAASSAADKADTTSKATAAPAATLTKSSTPTPAPKPAKKSGSGFATKGLLALLIGGVGGMFLAPKVAPIVPASIGQYLAATPQATTGSATANEELLAQLDALVVRVEVVEGSLNDLPENFPVLAGEAVSGASVDTNAIDAQFADLTAQLDALKNAPQAVTTAEGTVDLGPIQTELDALRAQNDALRSDLDAKLTATTQAVAEQETIAVAAVDRAEQTTALAALKVAAIQGRGFANELNQLRDVGLEVPEDLAQLSNGVMSQKALEDNFGDYAIAAIRASNLAASGEGLFSGLTAQIGAQFTARSTTPQEGNTPDAVLSRAEDHLRQGDLNASLSELSTLPSEAQAEMAPWVSEADARLYLLNTIDALVAQPNSQEPIT